MGLESPTYVNDLVTTNPAASDDISQGDDHLRAIKTALKNTFPTASKAFYNPVTLAKSADFTVLATHMNTLFVTDTSGADVTYTLPTLAVGDAGWSCSFLKKTTDANVVFIQPAAGNVQSGEATVSKARRAVPGKSVRAIWDGTAWYIERAIGLPVGSVIPLYRSTLPPGFVYPYGQSLAAGTYPEGNALIGGTAPDARGRAVFGRDDMGGSAASRITNAGSGIVGTTLGATGGAQSLSLDISNLPAFSYTPAGTVSSSSAADGAHAHSVSGSASGSTDAGGVDHFHNQYWGTSVAGGTINVLYAGASGASGQTGTVLSSAYSHTHTVSLSVTGTSDTHTGHQHAITSSFAGTPASLGGSATAFTKMPPTIIMNMALVVE